MGMVEETAARLVPTAVDPWQNSQKMASTDLSPPSTTNSKEAQTEEEGETKIQTVQTKKTLPQT